jgi:hypothetical protein
LPQILRKPTAELDAHVSKVLERAAPELTMDNFYGELKKNGLSIQNLAMQYAEALVNQKPSQKTRTIMELLDGMGMTKQREKVQSDNTITILVNGENVQINSLLNPERTF